ncbi:ATPase, T2SS/T4P/T4SS family [Amnibacterium sp. CER49]|uniref:CpaF family protein n=1 Tax=Amnibacterium sp. CER49 TaxID=3039161 RepID=UPI00244D39BF|nr:ATPase, T2SS/T4P/T4SS family [Amnibacterium sp. CER49]MDH2445288.1 ATPase, T2SS/T4P/T4SS family [Amnibacterium sp. CER49]
MGDPVQTITETVRQRARRGELGGGPEEAIREELRRYAEHAFASMAPLIADERQAERRIAAELTGFGPLQPLLDDPDVEEIWINGPTRVFVARNGVSELTTVLLTEQEVRDLVERMLVTSGRRVDLSSPFVDASLPDGSRLHVVIPDITRRHWAVNIRKFSDRVTDLDRLVELGSLPRQAADFLRAAMLAGTNVLVSGATQAGKTTLLNALLAAGRPSDRIVTVEETFELKLPGRDGVAMQCRQPSLEGTGEVTLRRLIKEALRMRPDRLVVGEVREAEALDLLIALNSGIPGACSIHANSARDALAKLCTLPLLAGRNIDSAFVVPTVAGAVELVVHCELQRGGARRVTEILAPTGRLSAPAASGGVIEASRIFALDGGVLRATGALPARTEKLVTAGIDVADLLGTGR